MGKTVIINTMQESQKKWYDKIWNVHCVDTIQYAADQMYSCYWCQCNTIMIIKTVPCFVYPYLGQFENHLTHYRMEEKQKDPLILFQWMVILHWVYDPDMTKTMSNSAGYLQYINLTTKNMNNFCDSKYKVSTDEQIHSLSLSKWCISHSLLKTCD